ncbi:hypothetical protein FRB97_007354 [Tulasnella sp. 331]|nr:hypothetical protein FRB97_007354 [Tulasnella sp. 331]KAG8873523.1 hypothetical protein FRB98_008913 [Tulasnella sp. 332]
MAMDCGPPKVTLVGERDKWARLLLKIEELNTLGPETAHWYTSLKPVLGRFVKTFDNPERSETKHFRNHAKYMTKHPWFLPTGAVLDLDGILYHQINTCGIPKGYAEVGVKLGNIGEEFDTVMVAGLVSVSDRNVPETQGERDAFKKAEIDAARKALEEQTAKN